MLNTQAAKQLWCKKSHVNRDGSIIVDTLVYDLDHKFKTIPSVSYFHSKLIVKKLVSCHYELPNSQRNEKSHPPAGSGFGSKAKPQFFDSVYTLNYRYNNATSASRWFDSLLKQWGATPPVLPARGNATLALHTRSVQPQDSNPACALLPRSIAAFGHNLFSAMFCWPKDHAYDFNSDHSLSRYAVAAHLPEGRV